MERDVNVFICFEYAYAYVFKCSCRGDIYKSNCLVDGVRFPSRNQHLCGGCRGSLLINQRRMNPGLQNLDHLDPRHVQQTCHKISGMFVNFVLGFG